jgi:hypothetical protein
MRLGPAVGHLKAEFWIVAAAAGLIAVTSGGFTPSLSHRLVLIEILIVTLVSAD